LNIRVVISYFDAKIGPMVFYFYPEEPPLDDLLSKNIPGLMDQNINQSFFTFSLDPFHALNYSFEIDSPRPNWARGKKESLLLSIVIDEHLSQEIEQVVINLCGEFIENIHLDGDLYAAFHLNDMARHSKTDKELIVGDFRAKKKAGPSRTCPHSSRS